MTTLPMQFESHGLAESSAIDKPQSTKVQRTRRAKSIQLGQSRAEAREQSLMATKPWAISLAVHVGIFSVACIAIAALASQAKPIDFSRLPLHAAATGKPPSHSPARTSANHSQVHSAQRAASSTTSVHPPTDAQGTDESSNPASLAAFARAKPSSLIVGPGKRLAGPAEDNQTRPSSSEQSNDQSKTTDSSSQAKASQARTDSTISRARQSRTQAGPTLINEPQPRAPNATEDLEGPKQVADSAALPQFLEPGQGSGPGPFGIDMTLPDGSAPRRIAFVVDASGSLVDTFPLITKAISQSISRLRPDQQFTVILFQGENILEPAPFGLQPKTSDRRLAVDRWLGEITAQGRTKPIPAIKRALNYKPDNLVLISDNITSLTNPSLNQRSLLAAITKANDAQTPIHTIQFLHPDPLRTVPGKTPTLKRIARQTDGHYLFVSKEDLGLGRR